MLRGERAQLRMLLPQEVCDYVNRLNAPSRGRAPTRPFRPVSRCEVTAAYGRDSFISEESTVLALDSDGRMHLGYGCWYPASSAVGNIEVHVHVYDTRDDRPELRAEAYRLLCRYLFDSRPIERVQLMLHPGDDIGQESAAASGFRKEGSLTSMFFALGEWQDVELWSVLREELTDARG